MVFETVFGLAGAALAGATGQGAVRRVLQAMERRAPISRDVAGDLEQQASLGQRMADAVAKVGGSWGFVAAFCLFLAAWALLNTYLLPRAERFDPYPFIFLNLLLSMLAAIQAPIIMMSQNRQSEKDRVESRHDYEVNLKAELEIIALHEKLDRLHEDHAAEFAALRTLLSAEPAHQALRAGQS